MHDNWNKGMTLVELIIALAILGIIAVAFLSSFTGGFGTIMTMGRKTAAMTELQTMMDQIYEAGTPTDGFITGLGADNTALNAPYMAGDDYRYAINPVTVAGSTMTQVDLLAFYENGKRHVTLTALIP